MFHAQTSDIAEKIVFSSSKQSENFSKKYQRRQWHPTPVLLPGKSHGWRSLVGCSPWGREESDTTEWLHFHFSLSCIAEGNGNPLQCSCLENPRDGGAWWVPIYGVAQSRTRLKQLSSSSHLIPDKYKFPSKVPYTEISNYVIFVFLPSPPGNLVSGFHYFILVCQHQSGFTWLPSPPWSHGHSYHWHLWW